MRDNDRLLEQIVTLEAEIVYMKRRITDYRMLERENDALRKRSDWLEHRVVELEIEASESRR